MRHGQRARHVLLVSHEASRTGAPKMAVEVAAGLRQAGWGVHGVVRWPGPLEHELAAASDALTREPGRRLRVGLRRLRATRPLAVSVEERAARRLLERTGPDLVWANTALSACYVRPALVLGIPVVLHVHELEPWTSQILARYRLDTPAEGLHLVACSPVVRRQLASRFSVPLDAIGYLPSSVDVAGVRQAAGTVAPDSSRVVACGTADTRKGIDLWLDVAESVRASGAYQVRFRWVGGPVPHDVLGRAENLITDGTVTFVGAVPNPAPELAAATVFTLPSRADAFPLVVLEAMALERPVVAFDVGGVAAQVGDAGVLVPPGETEAMAAAVVDLLEDPDRRRELGMRAGRRAKELFDVAVFRSLVTDYAADVVGLP